MKPSSAGTDEDRSHLPFPRRVFLLSPANTSGDRAKLLLSPYGKSDLALKLRRDNAEIAEIYTFISGLYFRGKLAYAQRFADPPPEIPGTLVITPGRGLLRPETPISLSELQQIATIPVDAADSRYREPLTRDSAGLAAALGEDCEVVLLGSIATPKYIEPLLGALADRLLFPSEFAGRGDMSRGGLLLRSAREGVQLTYVPAISSMRRGSRPPRLPKLRRESS
jgi:hypothetical protein